MRDGMIGVEPEELLGGEFLSFLASFLEAYYSWLPHAEPPELPSGIHVLFC